MADKADARLARIDVGEISDEVCPAAETLALPDASMPRFVSRLGSQGLLAVLTKDDRMLVIDTSTDEVSYSVDIREEGASYLLDVVYDGGSEQSFVLCRDCSGGWNGCVVTVGPDGAIGQRIDVGEQPGAMAIHHESRLVFVANGLDDTVSVIDGATGEKLPDIPVGQDPVDLAVDQLGSMVYVANHLSSTVSVIDPMSGAVVQDVEVAEGPTRLALDELGPFVYVACDEAGGVSYFARYLR